MESWVSFPLLGSSHLIEEMSGLAWVISKPFQAWHSESQWPSKPWPKWECVKGAVIFQATSWLQLKPEHEGNELSLGTPRQQKRTGKSSLRGLHLRWLEYDSEQSQQVWELEQNGTAVRLRFEQGPYVLWPGQMGIWTRVFTRAKVL